MRAKKVVCYLFRTGIFMCSILVIPHNGLYIKKKLKKKKGIFICEKKKIRVFLYAVKKVTFFFLLRDKSFKNGQISKRFSII